MDRPEFSAQPLEGSPASGDAASEPVSSGGHGAAEPSPRMPASATEAGPAKRAASKPIERPLTIGQLQRVLEMRLGFTVSINTLERWCRQAKIYAVRLGPEWRIPRQAVEELIKTALAGDRL